MEKCLIICRNPSGLSKLRRFKSERPVIVASDDPHVHETARKMSGVAEVTYIEKGESFWSVATDVKTIIGQIDEWLSSLNPALPKEVLAWGIHIEGGFTGQRVQDALLLIRSYFYLFTAFHVREVHTIVDPSSAWEDQVIMACAEARSLPFQRHSTGSFEIRKSSLTRALIPFVKSGYFLFHEALLGAGRPYRAKSQIDLNGTIIFQLCSSLPKHVDNVKHIMSALVERGETPVGLCWSAGGRIVKPTGFEQLTASGIAAIGLERFVSLRDMLISYWLAAVIFLKARQRLNLLRFLRYEGVQLTPLLDESIRHFIIAMLPPRLRYARALRACLENGRPIAIKPWGGGDFFEGKMALRLLRNGKDSIYIHYWVGAGIPNWPYTDLTYSPDVFLAKSQFEAEIAMQEYELKKPQVEVLGQARFEHMNSFADHNPVERSRRQLNLPLDGNLYVGVDPGCSLRGFRAYREQVELLLAVLAAAQEVPGLVVVIKPHPSYGINHLMPLIKPYKDNNVVVLSAAAPVEHFLNSIDIVITKYSTLILEAALLGRCTIAAIFDGEDRFKVFGDMPVLVKSGGELENLLIRLASDGRVFGNWNAEQLSLQEKLLPRYYFSSDNPSSIAAERIIRDLRSYREIRTSRI